jgi:hypothetical protein
LPPPAFSGRVVECSIRAIARHQRGSANIDGVLGRALLSTWSCSICAFSVPTCVLGHGIAKRLALLPVTLMTETISLRRAPPAAVPQAQRALWLLNHSDLRRTARNRAIMYILATALSSERGLFEADETGGRHDSPAGSVSSAPSGESKRRHRPSPFKARLIDFRWPRTDQAPRCAVNGTSRRPPSVR